MGVIERRKTRKRVALMVFIIFLVIQVHSYWQFRYMMSAYFDQSEQQSIGSGNVQFRLIEPFFYAFEVVAVRIYHEKRLFFRDYLDPDARWSPMSTEGLYKSVSDVNITSGNSEGVGDEYFSRDQIHFSGCSMTHFTPNCDRRYIIFDDYLCSFQSNISISFNNIRCQQFFTEGGHVYTDFGGMKFKIFADYPSVKPSRGR